MELEWTKTSNGSYAALGVEEDGGQVVTLVIKHDKKSRTRPWTVRVSKNGVESGLIGRQVTLREAKHLAYIYCTRGLEIQDE